MKHLRKTNNKSIILVTCLLLIMLILISHKESSADSKALQAETVYITIEADTYIYTHPYTLNQNYGSSPTIILGADSSGYNYDILLNFDIASKVPSNARILEATLNMVSLREGGAIWGFPFTIYPINQSWNEFTVTANNRPTYHTDVALHHNLDEEHQVMVFNIDEIMQKWVNGEIDEYGLYLTANVIQNTESFYAYDPVMAFSPLVKVTYIECDMDKDSDGDGLPDGMEVCGYDNGLSYVDLPAMGADPLHKDIFVFVEWIEGQKPSEGAMQSVVTAFNNAPVVNPDNESGINLHIVYGEEIGGTEENQVLGSIDVVDEDCIYSWNELDSIKSRINREELWPIFHYALFAKELPAIPCMNNFRPGGISRPDTGGRGGSDFIVAVNPWLDRLTDAVWSITGGTFMHELGHNLGLGHGGVLLDSNGDVVGADPKNHEPNHLSVMNYSFMTRGLRVRGLLGLYFDGFLDYSRFGSDVLPVLNEGNLSESGGMNASFVVSNYGTRFFCANKVSDPLYMGDVVDGLDQPIDWNCDGDEDDENVSVNINKGDPSVLEEFDTVNEWEHLVYDGGAVGDFALIPTLPVTTSLTANPEFTFEEDWLLGPYPHVKKLYLPLVVN